MMKLRRVWKRRMVGLKMANPSDFLWVTVNRIFLPFLSERILHGFISLCKSDSDPEKRVARIRHETQIHILNLFITSLELNAPNLGLYLLGYEVKKPVSSTNLQDPGQCIHGTRSNISDVMLP